LSKPAVPCYPQDMERRIFGFPPVAGENPRVLILGSMPSVRSLEYGRYYGHPRNHFWKLILSVLELPWEEEYAGRLDILKKRGIALWDVIAHCRREGSLDQAIRDPEYNDVMGFIGQFPGLRLVCFNGSRAEREFFRNTRHVGKSPEYLRLPSSSPIPTRLHRKWEDKLPEWRIIADHLDEVKP